MSRNLSISGEGRQRALMHGNPRNMLKTHFAGPAAGENRILDSTGGSLMLSRFLCAGICALSLASAATVSSQPTFYKDVLPLMQKRCQNCHRPGEVAPMSFLTYKDVRPWAKAIREAVLTRKILGCKPPKPVRATARWYITSLLSFGLPDPSG